MRILHVIESLAPRRGGPVTLLSALVCTQARAGHDVTILTTNQDYPNGVLRPAGDDWICDGLVHAIYCSSQIAALNLSFGIARLLSTKITDFDIIHIHGLYRFPSACAAYVARKKGVPYIIRPHGSLDPYMYRRSSKSLFLKRLWERYFDLPSLRQANAIHYTAEAERQLAGFLEIKSYSFILPNGIDWAPYERLPKRGEFRARYNLGEAPLVLFVGRLHHKKGFNILIPGFDFVRREIPEARLAIIGPDNEGYGAQIDEWIREHKLQDAVCRIDFLSGVDLIQAYVDADVFALPSYTENFGMTVVEAMACRLPVVISNNVNIYQDIEIARCGLIVDMDAVQLSSALLKIIRDPQGAKTMGSAGRAYALKRYSWSGIESLLTHEYMEAIRAS